MSTENYEKKILIVDDSYEKVELLAGVINELPFVHFESCQDSREAIKKMRSEFFDILIVDIQIPDFLGDSVSKSGGKALIDRCMIDRKIIAPTHIIGVTSHKESYDLHKDYFISCGWPLFFKNFNQDSIKKILNSYIRHTYSRLPKFDVAIITALRKRELDAVLNLPCEWEMFKVPGESGIYYRGTFVNSYGATKNILATSCSRMGVASSAAVTMKVLNLFEPRLLVMTGIAAGVKDKVQLGDIIVADPCWDWGSGKQTLIDGNVVFQSAPHQLPLTEDERFFFQEIAARRTFLDEIRDSWQGGQNNSLQLHVGPLATGSVVLQDPNTVESIKAQHRETLGIEMEGYGFLYACSLNGKDNCKAIVIKSVCDFADPDKNDDWQTYAAFTSSQMAFRYLKERV